MTFATPRLTLPAIDATAARRVLDQAVNALLWAIAITYTAGRLTRIVFEWARPGLAKAARWLADLLLEPPAAQLALAVPPPGRRPADLSGTCCVLKAQGYTQHQIAERLGISRAKVQRLLAAVS